MPLHSAVGEQKEVNSSLTLKWQEICTRRDETGRDGTGRESPETQTETTRLDFDLELELESGSRQKMYFARAVVAKGSPNNGATSRV